MTLEIILIIVIVIAISAFALFKILPLSKSRSSRHIKKANQFLLESEDYYLMKNVVLLTFDGLQKFDYIIVSRFGIFVVMVQYYSGLIEGAEYEKSWSQIKRGKVKKQFSNPTDVINERIGTVCGLLSVAKSQVFPVVFFDGISGFKNQLSNKFTFGANYLKYIRSKNKLIFSANQISKFVATIDAKRKRQGLVNYFDENEKRQQTVAPLLQENACPQCGSPLEIRDEQIASKTSKQSLVCQLYPTCRYSREI